ncbi:hypothetical protein TCAL_15186 [Tigriopus californicus]|uniref:Histidine decarboxylase n=1 Tax=Tigriopus californicus TaxID=6832 RepID=A0A553NC34_TIGCA|nr:hypothetical protein TCAL_15186 [Tigriopus californicus]
MDAHEYRDRGKKMIDYIADYLENIRERDVFPHVQPITHWQSPYMHAYFPALNSYPSLLGDMLANGVNCLGFTWASSPACTELEIVTMDWLAKAIGLPDDFLHSKTQSHGGGVIQTTASESTFVCLWPEERRPFEISNAFSDAADAEINSRLVLFVGSSPFICGEGRISGTGQDPIRRE